MSNEESQKIYMEVMLGKEPSIDTPEANALREEFEKEILFAKEKGYMLEVPHEWPVIKDGEDDEHQEVIPPVLTPNFPESRFRARQRKPVAHVKSNITEYRGYKIEKVETTQVGYKLPNSRGTLAKVGIGNSRKQNGVMVTEPDGHDRFFDNMKKAKEWIDNQIGDEKSFHTKTLDPTDLHSRFINFTQLNYEKVKQELESAWRQLGDTEFREWVAKLLACPIKALYGSKADVLKHAKSSLARLYVSQAQTSF